ncbi:acetyltransferase [Colletotrichum filicis]|nr:acetyltransferase [Colletotrichum filicis]
MPGGILPASHAKSIGGAPAWPDAVVPSVSQEEEAGIQRVAVTAHWDPNEESDDLLVPIWEAEDEILRLDYLAVHPDNQGQGIGTALIKSGISKAEGSGLAIFIHAMEDGGDLYKRLGFVIGIEFLQDDTK